MFYITQTSGSASLEKNVTPFYTVNDREEREWQMEFSDNESGIMDAMVDSMISTADTFIFTNRMTKAHFEENKGSITVFKDDCCANIAVTVNYLKELS